MSAAASATGRGPVLGTAAQPASNSSANPLPQARLRARAGRSNF
jgi:hypothetical protein